jgi:hypothetical protein
MDFYIFSTGMSEVKELQEYNYSGALFTYNIGQGDFFTQISRNIVVGEKFKYMVAIRPYVISPQYLWMINKSIKNIDSNRLQINLISGWIKPEEKEFGGILGEVHDLSSNVDRSNYLIEYIDLVEKISSKTLDYYVSTTNEFVFDAAEKYKSKMIIPYSKYKRNAYDLENKQIMMSIAPTLRETEEEIDLLNKDKTNSTDDVEYFSYQQFIDFINELKDKNINEIMLHCWDVKERKIINNFVKEYKEKELQ